jgi:hypothetical protein
VKFLCLAYYDEKKFDALPRDEMRAIVSRCPPHDEALHESGHLRSVASLESPGKAVSIRPKGGKPIVSDGPFAETKEQLGSFFLIEAKDMEEAVKVASLHPAAHLGEHVGWGIEVRAIDFCRAGEPERKP